MKLWRVYYENGFWGDEIAWTKEEVRVKAEQMAIDNGTRVIKIQLEETAMKVHYKFISNVKDGYQYFEGVCKHKFFSARFGNHLLVINFNGKENTFIEGDGWPTSEKKRKAIIEEYLEWV